MNLEKIINNFLFNTRQSYEEAGDSGIEYFGIQKFENIVICGMGGSALAGELLALTSKALEIKIPLYIYKNYDLPAVTTKNSLVITVSYSGNTEETISSYKRALEQGFKTAVITSGGMLKKLSQQDNLPLALLPENIPPRFALGYMLGALLRLCANAGVIKKLEHHNLTIIGSNSSETADPELKKLAKKIKDLVPLIYSSEKNKALAYIFKIQFNETAKKHAFYNIFPELNHNEIMGFKDENKKFCVILIKDASDHTRIQKRMQVTEDIIKKQGYAVYSIDIDIKIWYNVLYTVQNAMRLSYLIAKEKNIDPIKTDLIDTLKKSL